MDAAADMLATDAGDDPAERVVVASPTPSHRILVYAKDGGRQVRFISDATEVVDGELIDVVSLNSQAEVDAINRAIGQIMQGDKLGASTRGWHRIVGEMPLHEFLTNLFRAAKNTAWADQGLPGRLELDDSFRLPATIPEALAALLPPRVPPSIAPPPLEPVEAPEDVVLPAPAPGELNLPKRTRAARVWTRERERAFVELILTGHSAKETAADPRILLSVDAVYQHASDIGMSFRASGQVMIAGLPASVLAVYDRAAGATHKSRDRFVRDWMMKAAADPARYGLLVC